MRKVIISFKIEIILNIFGWLKHEHKGFVYRGYRTPHPLYTFDVGHFEHI